MENTNEKKVKLSSSRKVIIAAIMCAGKIKWADLRREFYGPVRAKSGASTSFNGQLKRMTALGLIQKDPQGLYELAAKGEALYEECSSEEQESIDNSVSTARQLAEDNGQPENA